MKHALRFVVIITVCILSVISIQGCNKKNQRETNSQNLEQITLTFYGLYDNSDIFEPMIQTFKSAHPNINVIYKKFTDHGKYMDLILNELAEGEGPDIFMLQNSFFIKDHKKLVSAPDDIITPDIFRDIFLDVTANDLIINDDNGNSISAERIWGIPLYVDSLALYYNKKHFIETFPERPEPSKTWDKLREDVIKLNSQDNSFERFSRSGIAMGRVDNILRTFDTLMALILQYNGQILSEDLSTVTLDEVNSRMALEYLVSFSLPSQENYSWNKYLADINSDEKEITTFAKGKVSMITGYSFTYNDIVNEINRLKSLGIETISPDDIRITEFPQINDPGLDPDSNVTYANYFASAVSRTSLHQREAWEFLSYMINDENMSYYNEKTHKPSSKKLLVNDEISDPIYGVFAKQAKIAKSIKMNNPNEFINIFLSAVDDMLSTASSETVIRDVSKKINDTL